MGRHSRIAPTTKADEHPPARSKHNPAEPFPTAPANSRENLLQHDISSCQATEEALRRSEERFRLLFEQAVDGIFVSDATGHYTDVNRAGCEMLGYTREEILARSIADVVAPDERERIAPHVAEFGGGKVTRSEWRFVRKDSSVFVGEVVARQLPDGRLQAILRDISERRRAEEALRESERRYRNLFESMDQGCCIVQVLFDAGGRPRDLRFLEVNPAFERHTGLTQATGRTILELAPNIEERWSQLYGHVATTGESVRLQEFSPRLNRWFDLYAARVGEPGENKVAVLFYDITGRVQADEALRRSQAELREAQRVAHVGSWYWDASTDLTVGSDEMLRILGLDPGRDTLPRFREQRGSYYPAEDWERIRAASYQALETGAGYELEARAYRKGSEIWIIHHGEAVRDERGNITGLRGTVQDVTARKIAELELHQAQEQLRTVLLATGVGLWLHETNSGRLNWDVRTRELFFVRPGEEPSLELFWSRVHPEDREPVRLEAEAALREDRPYSKDLRTVHPESGRVRWIHAEGRWVRAADGTAIRLDGINYDITERQQFQAELERLVAERTARLQELVGELEHFSYAITHDLKAPLRAMRGFAEMAGQVCGQGDARPFLEKISRAAERMDGLIRDALNYGRALQQGLPLSEVDTEPLLRGILESYPQLEAWKERIRVEGPLPVVLGNTAGLTECFSNLLTNAVKFVRPGQPPEVRVWAEALAYRQQWCRIYFEDRGIGIAKELLPRVFDMFSRGSKEYEGTGIGLALVRKLVQRMGGRVGVESEEGEGSRFWIELKSAEPRSSPEEAETAAPLAPSGGTVLYVEDEESDATFMRKAFAVKGLEATLRVASDGRAAIEYLSGTGKYGDRREYPLPAVVLLDLNLPLVPGFEVLQWMRNHPDFAKTPVMVFSSSTREDDRVKARELGANGFVTKPSSWLEFGRVVEDLKEQWLRKG